jgi:hypothetical protein
MCSNKLSDAGTIRLPFGHDISIRYLYLSEVVRVFECSQLLGEFTHCRLKPLVSLSNLFVQVAVVVPKVAVRGFELGLFFFRRK